MRNRRATITAQLTVADAKRRVVQLQASARRWLVQRRLRVFVNLRALRMAIRRERAQMRNWLKLLFCICSCVFQIAFLVRLREPELISSINQAVASYISDARAPDPSCVGSTRRLFEETVLRQCMAIDEDPAGTLAEVRFFFCCV
jgi:hypothetical protein